MHHPSLSLLSLALLLGGCGDSSGPSDFEHTGGADTGGTASGGSVTGGQSGLGTGGMTTGGIVGDGGSGGVSQGGSGATDSGGASATGGDSGTGGEDPLGSGGNGEGTGGEPNWADLAGGLHELFIHDACTGAQPAQDDTCTHQQLIEETIVFGGDAATTYLVTLRVRGLFEPTNISGGEAPLTDHPYFVVGGTVQAADYSQWQIEVQDPPQIYYLNHYPQTSHTIYQEDFEAPIVVAGGSDVVVRVVDANNRQIDNGRAGLPDRQQMIEGVTDEVLDGQILRLDVVGVDVE